MRVLKSDRKAPRREKRSKQGPKTGPSRGGKMVPRGWTNASRSHFFTLRWSDVLSDCNFTHFTSFLTSKMTTFISKSYLFLRSLMIHCSLCTSAPDVKKKKRESSSLYLMATASFSDARGTGLSALLQAVNCSPQRGALSSKFFIYIYIQYLGNQSILLMIRRII